MRRIRRNLPLMIVNPRTGRRGKMRKSPDGEMVISIQDLYDMLNDDKQIRKLDQAVERFRLFHGCEPTEVIAKDIPIGEDGEMDFFVGMGRAPAEPYDAKEIRGSNKRGSIFVHEYGEDGGRKPLKAMTRDGKMVVTLPGDWYIDDWMRG